MAQAVPTHPSRVGPYVVTGTLALGGMAQICSAVDTRSGREVVLKLILQNLCQDPEFVKFFIHEGELGLRLKHPHLVETLDAGEDGGTHYIVLERLHGQSTIELLRQVGTRGISMPLGIAIRVVADAARGLHAAHVACDDHGRPLSVVHRDVTPHNVFICSSGHSKVLDFGIAKAESQHHRTRTGILKGKFAYLAPEQIRGEASDHRVDIFALGTVLYELLTQRPLFRGNHDAETLQRVLNLEIPLPERVRRQVPPALGALAMRALQRDPNRRIPTAAALADSLDAVASAELIDSSPEAVAEFLAEVFPELEIDPDLQDIDSDGVAQIRKVLGEVRARAPEPEMSAETPPAGVAPLDGRTSEALVALRAQAQARRTPWLVGVAAAVVATAAVCLAIGIGTRAPVASLAAAPTPVPQPQSAAVAQPQAVVTPAVVPAVAPPLPTPPPPPSTVGKVETGVRFVGDGPFEIHVDGRLVSSSDGLASMSPGKHQVHADSPTFSRSLKVKLAAGEIKVIRARTGIGRLRIAATPWAEVSIDDKPQGTTPFRVLELGEGPHTVVLTNPELHVSVRRRIQIPANKETVLKVDLFHGP